MAPDRTILHLFKKNPGPPPPLKNYGVHTIKPQLRPCDEQSENIMNTFHYSVCEVNIISSTADNFSINMN